MSTCSASEIRLGRLSLILCLRSASDSVSSSLEKTLNVWLTSLFPPIASIQSSTTSDSNVGVRSSFSVGILPWNLIFPPFVSDRSRQSSLELRS